MATEKHLNEKALAEMRSEDRAPLIAQSEGEWNECPVGHWMIESAWAVGVEPKLIVLATLAVARETLFLVPEEERPFVTGVIRIAEAVGPYEASRLQSLIDQIHFSSRTRGASASISRALYAAYFLFDDDIRTARDRSIMSVNFAGSALSSSMGGRRRSNEFTAHVVRGVIRYETIEDLKQPPRD